MADRSRPDPGTGEVPCHVELPEETAQEASRFHESLESLNRQLERKFEEVRLLGDVSQKLTSGVMLGEVLDFIFTEFQALAPYDRIGLSLLEGHPPNVVVRSSWVRTNAAKVLLGEDFCAPLAGSSLETIIRTGKPRILNDLRLYLKEHPKSESTRLIVEEGIRSSLTCPLVVQGSPIGFLFFSSATEGAYEGWHVAVFQALASAISLAVERGRLYGQLYEIEHLKRKLRGGGQPPL